MPDSTRVGQVAMTGSAIQLSALPKSVAGVLLKAHRANTDDLYFGHDNTVSSTTGFELSPGDAVPMDLVNPGRLYVIGTAADRLSWATVGA